MSVLVSLVYLFVKLIELYTLLNIVYFMCIIFLSPHSFSLILFHTNNNNVILYSSRWSTKMWFQIAFYFFIFLIFFIFSPDPPSHLHPHRILHGHPSAPALNTLSCASNLDWQSISHMIIYMFQCYSLKSSHPRLLPQNPKICSLHLCLFCCLTYRVIVAIFLNSIYMH